MVRRHRLCCDGKPYDLVICKRPWSTISPYYSEGLYELSLELISLLMRNTQLTYCELQVHAKTRVPVVAVAVVTLIPCLLNLIYIGSSTAFNDVISMSVSGLYASYLLPCSFLLWRRLTGQIKPHRPNEDNGIDISFRLERDPNMLCSRIPDDSPNSDVLLEDDVLEWGPWRIPGLLGTLNNCFACIYCVWVLFWSFWPPALPVTAENMNYSVLVTGSVILFAVARYFLGGKVGYKGPLVDYEVRGFTARRS